MPQYTGTAKQSAGCLNTTLGVTEGFAFIAVKAALDPKSPINSGSMRPIRVIAPRGSCLNAIPPAACGGLGELGQAMIFTMVAMGKLVPHQVTAEEPSSINHQNLDGLDTRPEGGRFVFYDAVSGGCGDALRAARRMTAIERGGEPAFAAGMRLGWAAPGSALVSDSRVEIFTEARPHPLVLRIAIDDSVGADNLRIDTDAWHELGLESARPEALVRVVPDIWP